MTSSSLTMGSALQLLRGHLDAFERSPTLLASSDSSCLNDLLRTFATRINCLRVPRALPFALASAFDALPEDLQFTVCGFFNASSLSQLARVNRMFRDYLYQRAEFLPRLARAAGRPKLLAGPMASDMLSTVQQHQQQQEGVGLGRFLTLGDRCDARDRDGRWYGARVVAADATTVRVHFDGFAERWDETLPRDGDRVTPFRAHSTAAATAGPTPTPVEGVPVVNNLAAALGANAGAPVVVVLNGTSSFCM